MSTPDLPIPEAPNIAVGMKVIYFGPPAEIGVVTSSAMDLEGKHDPEKWFVLFLGDREAKVTPSWNLEPVVESSCLENVPGKRYHVFATANAPHLEPMGP